MLDERTRRLQVEFPVASASNGPARAGRAAWKLARNVKRAQQIDAAVTHDSNLVLVYVRSKAELQTIRTLPRSCINDPRPGMSRGART